MNRFEYAEDGSLRHYINDELRAVVAAAHVEEYRATWPDAPEPPAPKE